MSRLAAIALLVIALVALPARGLAIEPGAVTTGPELAGTESGLDGQVIEMTGEVVSEILRGGDSHVWLNVLSEGTAIGIWAPAELAEDLAVFGDWGHTGDIVAITGVFNEACDVHGGDLDVHAIEMTLIERGSEREHPISYWKLGIGFGGALIAYAGLRRMRRAEAGGTV